MRRSQLASAMLLLPLAILPSLARGAEPPPRPRIEVAFALDATGSMGPYIAQARARIREIAADLSKGNPEPDVRFALVAYRDKGDAFVTRIEPFTRDVEVVHKALDATTADGGGDTPESVLEGLRDAVTGLDWTPPADAGVVRLVYLVGDAPPHNYAGGPTEAWIGAEARRRRIAIHGIVCGTDFETVEPIFETFARHTEGRVFRLGSGGGRSDRDSASLGAAMTDTTKAYSSSIGVHFDDKNTVALATVVLAAPPVKSTGLLGAEVRWVRDQAAWSDVWAAHTSLMAARDRPPAPVVDFATHHVLVVGGSDAGLAVDGLVSENGQRAARVHPVKDKGVQFLLVPASAEGGK